MANDSVDLQRLSPKRRVITANSLNIALKT